MKHWSLTDMGIGFAVIIMLGCWIVAVLNMSEEGSLPYGVNGLAEKRCIDGYEFIVGQSGSVQQILNAQGGGVACR